MRTAALLATVTATLYVFGLAVAMPALARHTAFPAGFVAGSTPTTNSTASSTPSYTPSSTPSPSATSTATSTETATPTRTPTATVTPWPASVIVRIDSATIPVGDPQGRKLNLDALGLPPPGLGSWTVDVTYDQNVVQAFQCDTSASGGVCNLAFAPNKIRVTGGSNGLQGNITLASLRFRCPWEGASALTVAVIVFLDATQGSPNSENPATIDGAITCSSATETSTPTATATASATSTATEAATPTDTPIPTAGDTATPTPTLSPTPAASPSVTPTPESPTATATPTGTPTSIPTATATPTATLEKDLGDVNDDGEVNSVDALLVVQFDAELLDHLSNAPSADVNENGIVNSVDAALILQFTAGLIHSLPPPSFP